MVWENTPNISIKFIRDNNPFSEKKVRNITIAARASPSPFIWQKSIPIRECMDKKKRTPFFEALSRYKSTLQFIV